MPWLWLVLISVAGVGLLLALGVGSLLYFFKAETTEPLTLEELGLTWRTHKRKAGCEASSIKRLIKRKEDVVGFACECGYVFRQTRRITQDRRK
jgi:hypothetical protein